MRYITTNTLKTTNCWMRIMMQIDETIKDNPVSQVQHKIKINYYTRIMYNTHIHMKHNIVNIKQVCLISYILIQNFGYCIAVDNSSLYTIRLLKF